MKQISPLVSTILGRNGNYDFTKNQYTYITHLDQMIESEFVERSGIRKLRQIFPLKIEDFSVEMGNLFYKKPVYLHHPSRPNDRKRNAWRDLVLGN